MTNHLEEIEIYEKTADQFKLQHQDIEFILDKVVHCNTKSRTITLLSGLELQYDKLCICSGVKPSVILPFNPLVIGIRDLESVTSLLKRLSTAKKILIVGNGGIALELIHEVNNSIYN